MDAHSGLRRIDWAFPPEIRESTNDHEMFIRLDRSLGGSTWQVAGSDNYQAIIGSGPRGIVYSEYMLSDPDSYLYLDPILRENNGWAIFNGTPRGRNHFHKLFQLGQSDPDWFSQVLTVRDTGALSDAQIAVIRRQLATERGDEEANNIINQEYYCSWDAAIPGSYYGAQITKAEEQGRIAPLPHDPRLPVITGWDIGVGDSTAIWFAQQVGYEIHFIDYYEASGVGADHYARILKEKDYLYEYHACPHDIEAREWGNNASSRLETLKALGVRPVRVQPRASVDDGINAVRVLLGRSRFDRAKTERGVSGLRQYQKTWDDKLKVFSNKPLHDWTSHGADAMRTLAQSLRDPGKRTQARSEYALT